jgi:triacylglycerol lipase
MSISSTSPSQPFLTKGEIFKNKVLLAGEYIKSTAVDLVHMVVLAVLFPFDQVKRDPKSLVHNSNSVPVILVHGYLDNSSSWVIQRYRLKKQNIRNVFTVNMGVLPKHSIEDCTEKLSKRIQEVKRITGSDKVILIGHSMGGVVSANYALNKAKDENTKVTDVLTLGSPLQGTKLARIGLGKSARQMETNSSFSNDLTKQISEEKEIRFHHVASKSDLIMRPWNTSLNGNEKPSEKDTIVKCGHITYLFSKKIGSKISDVVLGACGKPV